MNHLFQNLGYAGAVPFWVFTALIYNAATPETQALYQLLLLAYGSMILSFLGGVHWAHGLPRAHILQISLSMLPTIFSLLLIGFALFFPAYNFIWLILMGFTFWDLYILDRWFLVSEWLPQDYMRFRLNLTSIVSLAFFIAAGAEFL